MHDLTEVIRDHINDSRVSHLLRKSVYRWNLLTSSLDVIEDAELAIEAHDGAGAAASEITWKPDYQSASGSLYLATYGLLQALVIQQEAVFHVCEALDIPLRLKSFPKLQGIREIRNISVGHPTKVDRPRNVPVSHHFISRMTMGKHGFQLLSFYDDGTYSSRDVWIPAILEDQKTDLGQVLREVIDELERRKAAHVAEFRGEQLIDTFQDGLGYAFEKISSALYSSGPPELGEWGINVVDKAVSDFREALNRRGLEVGALEFVDFVFDELAYPIDQLKRYLRQEANDVPNTETARIFVTYIRVKVGTLQRIAQEIDESYGVDEINPTGGRSEML
jgi:hypothetical protein